MNTTDLKHLRAALRKWYFKKCRDLPWRRTDDPYPIWVSEVMLQQTQTDTVLKYYPQFLKKFPNIGKLAGADLQAVLKAWEGMGYYARARNLHRAAKAVVKEYSGKLPDTWEALHSLPGIGDYIAAAVLSIAFNQPHAVVDGNVKRVLARLHKIDAPVNRANASSRFKEAAARLLDTRQPGIFNQAMMELGALICKPRNPLCDACPLNRLCQAYQGRQVANFPKRQRLKPAPQYHIAVGVVFKNNRVLITRRQTEGLLGGLWEFPGGKIRNGESAQAACLREIKEEVNLSVRIGRHLARIRHAYTHFKIVMEVFCCQYRSGRVKLKGPAAFRWIGFDELQNYPFPGANHKFIPLLRQGRCANRSAAR